MTQFNNPINYVSGSNMNENNENNNSDNNSDDTYDSDYDDEEVFFEEGEECNTKYNIVLCEIFNNLIH